MDDYDTKSLEEIRTIARTKYNAVIPEELQLGDVIEWLRMQDTLIATISPRVDITTIAPIPTLPEIQNLTMNDANLPIIEPIVPTETKIPPLPVIPTILTIPGIKIPTVQQKYYLNDENTLRTLHGEPALPWQTDLATLNDARNQPDINTINPDAPFQARVLHPNYRTRITPITPGLPIIVPVIPTIPGVLTIPTITEPTIMITPTVPAPTIMIPPTAPAPTIMIPPTVPAPTIMFPPVVPKPIIIAPTIMLPPVVPKPIIIAPTVIVPAPAPTPTKIVIPPVIQIPTTVIVPRPIITIPTTVIVPRPMITTPTKIIVPVTHPVTLKVTIPQSTLLITKPVVPKAPGMVTLNIAFPGGVAKPPTPIGLLVATAPKITPVPVSPGVVTGAQVAGFTTIRTTTLAPTIPNVLHGGAPP